jgi:two-component system sensor histidine kinase YesM
MINWRLLAKGDIETSQSIVQLGQILQYSMSERAIVSLVDELQNVENYLALRKSNRDPDFSYTIKDVGGERIRLPKLSLQPIVENSILHGFAGRSFGNVLLITAFPEQGKRYCIEISDNGIGIDDRDLDSIYNPDLPIKQRPPSEKRKSHIGIKNVDQRIKYLYGDAFGVSVYSQYGVGTKVRIVVPEDCSDISVSELGNENSDSG